MLKSLTSSSTAQDQIIIYQTPDGETAVDVKLTENTIWLNQYQLADLFDKDRTSVAKHIKISIALENSGKIQLVQNLHQFKIKAQEKLKEKLHIIILI